MPQKKDSKTKQLLLRLGEHLKEEGHLWVDLLIGVTDLRYRRTFMGGGAEAVHRRRMWEKKKELRELLRALKRQQWIETRRIGNRVALALTQKGKAILRKEAMKNAPHCRRNECVITIFDIPEKQKFLRDHFRAFLKACGFRQLQRSVWMHACDVFKELQDFIEETKSEKWIRVFKVVNRTEKRKEEKR